MHFEILMKRKKSQWRAKISQLSSQGPYFSCLTHSTFQKPRNVARLLNVPCWEKKTLMENPLLSNSLFWDLKWNMITGLNSPHSDVMPSNSKCITCMYNIWPKEPLNVINIILSFVSHCHYVTIRYYTA